LAGAGWDVIAGVRRAEDRQALADAQPGRITSVMLDISDEAQAAALDRELPPTHGVAATIERALTARRPRARYVVGSSARVQALIARLTPTPILDRALRIGAGVPRRP
jgi:NAD(P)-dependent dehydrogenase (short-subunit alcohol dehydrogenase family)